MNKLQRSVYMLKEQFRHEETTRLLKWISKNKSIWNKIRRYNDSALSPEDYWHYFKLLRDQKFYDLLFMFISNNQDSIATYDYFENLGVLKFSELWDKGIFDQFEKYVHKEIKKQKYARDKRNQ